MRFYIAVGVASLGIGCYAAAALLWDRRNAFRQWISRKSPGEIGGGPFAAALATLLFLGTGLLVGSCVGLISF